MAELRRYVREELAIGVWASVPMLVSLVMSVVVNLIDQGTTPIFPEQNGLWPVVGLVEVGEKPHRFRHWFLEPSCHCQVLFSRRPSGISSQTTDGRCKPWQRLH
ncbi:hypothetical protein Sinac_5753 [Singulisphaera acidiphila DSM 18658]|uniref:Uncharacterized protein n=1 Tax=Singulisphaera acidiphila (strain ATCC BAA-1392 / DSM 18658 / VKM B-2454 / MOB10) TaxID=886293 RepID=L0DM25_SINAD|nr:hypothetical protein Sinac_5753 [Singulisphaera acidiphila DSM 18658]